MNILNAQDATGAFDQTVFHKDADFLCHRFTVCTDAAGDVGVCGSRLNVSLIVVDAVLSGQAQQLGVDPVFDT